VELYLLSPLRLPDSALSAAHRSVVSELTSLDTTDRSHIDIRSTCKQESSRRPATPRLKAYFHYQIPTFKFLQQKSCRQSNCRNIPRRIPGTAGSFLSLHHTHNSFPWCLQLFGSQRTCNHFTLCGSWHSVV